MDFHILRREFNRHFPSGDFSLTTTASEVHDSTGLWHFSERIPGVPISCGGLRTAAKHACVGSRTRVLPVGGRPPPLTPCVSCDFGGGYPSGWTAARLNSSIPEILFSGLGNFPDLIHRFSVVRPMPSFLASWPQWLCAVAFLAVTDPKGGSVFGSAPKRRPHVPGCSGTRKPLEMPKMTHKTGCNGVVGWHL